MSKSVRMNSGDSTLTRKTSQGAYGMTVPQTDTGRWVEDTKANETTLAKELGKITP
jgi:adenylate kinase family enzyme